MQIVRRLQIKEYVFIEIYVCDMYVINFLFNILYVI